MTTLRDATFRPGLTLTLQAVAAFLVVIGLAAWQFTRGLEKTALRDARVERLGAAPIGAAELSPATPDFTRVELIGAYDGTRQFFVSARRGRGFHVFTPFVSEAGVFLVNRGWFGASDMDTVRTVPTPAGETTLVAVAWPLPRLSPLVRNESWPADWPKRVRGVNPVRMAAACGARPRELRLQAGGSGALAPPSLAWDYAPGTHWGYVVQWLAIGAAVAVGFVFLGKRRGLRLAREQASSDL